MEDLDALLKRKAVGDILDNTAAITANGAGILADGRKLADKATSDYLTPKPWYVKLRSYSGDVFDISAFLARHYR